MTAIRSRSWAFALTGLLLASAFGIVATPATAQTNVEIMVLGETHGTRSMTQSLVKIAANKGATGCVCPGDFTYGHPESSPSQWRDMMRPFMGQMMPAQGNHDWPWSDWSGMFPGGAHYYDKDVGGVHFIALNTEYSLAAGSKQRAWLESNLAERDAGALKVVFMHRPWWLPDGARHEAAEFESKNGASASTMDALMRKHGVDLVVSAHEKNYQHSYRDGVHYLVAGGGGPSFYPMGYELPGAVKRLLANAVSTLEIGSTSMTIKSYDLYGAKIEEFTMHAGASSPAPSPDGSSGVTFTPKNGNEWWVQVAVSGSPRAVDARDTGGSWKPLSLKSWGDWAGSFHVEPGHDVQYRATLSDGSVVESCWYSGTTCVTTSAPAPSGAATFSPSKNQNEWWVQVGVSPTPRAVEARDTGGAWTPLELKSWGDWAASFRVEPGHQLQYRATLSDGSVVESCWYVGTVCATTSAFSVAWSGVSGNEWWIQAKATASGGTLAGVDARVDGGSWKPLELKSWGSWAKSIHAPSGSSVELRATSTTGATATSGKYAWPPN